MIELLLAILIIALIMIGAITWLDYGVHVSQVKKFTNEYGKANYKTFLAEFNKIDWRLDEYNKSLFYFSNGSITSMICAGLIKFNGIGMIMQNPIEYLKANVFVYKYLSNVKRQGEVKSNYSWKEEVR